MSKESLRTDVELAGYPTVNKRQIWVSDPSVSCQHNDLENWASQSNKAMREIQNSISYHFGICMSSMVLRDREFVRTFWGSIKFKGLQSWPEKTFKALKRKIIRPRNWSEWGFQLPWVFRKVPGHGNIWATRTTPQVLMSPLQTID